MERRLTKRGQAEAKKSMHNHKLKAGEMKKKCRESENGASPRGNNEHGSDDDDAGLVLDWQVRVQDLSGINVTLRTQGRCRQFYTAVAIDRR